MDNIVSRDEFYALVDELDSVALQNELVGQLFLWEGGDSCPFVNVQLNGFSQLDALSKPRPANL